MERNHTYRSHPEDPHNSQRGESLPEPRPRRMLRRWLWLTGVKLHLPRHTYCDSAGHSRQLVYTSADL